MQLVRILRFPRMRALKLGRAVRAAGCIVRDFALAEGANARHLLRRFRFRLLGLVDRLHHQEHAERNQDEVDDVLDERAVIDGSNASSVRFLDGLERHTLNALQRDEQSAEVHAARKQAQDRHKDVVDKRRCDRAKRAADDNADRHVYDISPHRKCLELLKKLFHTCPSFRNVVLW